MTAQNGPGMHCLEDSFDALQMYKEVFIGGFTVLCKLLRVSHSYKQFLVLGARLVGALL